MQRVLLPITEKYKELSDPNSIPVYHKHITKVDMNGKIPVWVCWWQGEDQMPPIVKVCYQRVCRAFQNSQTKVILITENNCTDYIDFPQYITEKYEKGLIGKAHFADLLRWGLMANYGGIWLDATILITFDDISKIKPQMSLPFYTQRFSGESECPNEPSRGLWAGFYFMGGHDGDFRIFQFVYDSLLYYWERYDFALHYVFLDYIIWAGFQNIAFIQKLIDDVPPNNKHIWSLCKLMNEPYDDSKWTEMMNNGDVYKLTYKDGWKEYDDTGKITFYGHLLQELHNNI